MAAASSFAVPSSIPQDLQLIQDIIGDVPLPLASKQREQSVHSDHDHGTDSDTDSEKEVEEGILGDVEQDADGPSESTSESDSSSDSESEAEEAVSRKLKTKRPEVEIDDDEDAEPAATSESQLRTKNELVDIAIVVPEVEKVEEHEHLEKVGEVMSIVNNVVIVKGIPSAIVNRGSEKALDSDTLLVFEDRKVLGYIFETFGPTSEPLYQIRFNLKHPLDTEKVQVGRPVFHVPARSNYVFVQQLRHLKGSDASNVHDEEPGEDEIEFSDDEQEAAHKRAQNQRRERSRSVASSRHATPFPSSMRDQDMVEDPYGGTSFSGLSYNDMDLGAGPSRPPPIPYDDPYSDAYGLAPPQVNDEQDDEKKQRLSPVGTDAPRPARGRGRGGPARDTPPHREDTGRGRGRGRRQFERGRGRGRGRGGEHRVSSDSWSGRQGYPSTEHDRTPRPVSPTSLAIARATGQYSDSINYDANMAGNGGWGHTQYPMQPFDFSYPYQYPQVQPHINPRFAANFGMAGMGMGYAGYSAQPAPYSSDASGYAVGGSGHNGWPGDWTASQAPPGQDGSNQNS